MRNFCCFTIATELTADEGMLTPRDMVQLLLTQRLKSLSLEYYPREDRLGLYLLYQFLSTIHREYIHSIAVYQKYLT